VGIPEEAVRDIAYSVSSAEDAGYRALDRRDVYEILKQSLTRREGLPR